MYREQDQIAELRSKLDAVSSEIATLKSAKAERSGIAFKDKSGDALPWVSSTLFGLFVSVVFAGTGALIAEKEGYRVLAIILAISAVACLVMIAVVWFKALPSEREIDGR